MTGKDQKLIGGLTGEQRERLLFDALPEDWKDTIIGFHDMLWVAKTSCLVQFGEGASHDFILRVALAMMDRLDAQRDRQDQISGEEERRLGLETPSAAWQAEAARIRASAHKDWSSP